MFGDHPEATGAQPDVRRRIMAYFRSLGYRDQDQLKRLADAAILSREEAAEPADIALADLRRTVAATFRAGLAMEELSDERAEVLGRAAFLTADGASRWPNLFLVDGEAIADFRGQLATAMLMAVPPECPGAMPEQSLDPIARDWARTLGLEPKRHPA